MTQFDEDQRREQVHGDFLDEYFYDRVAESSTRHHDEQRQKAGIDVTAQLPWTDQPVAVDEKIQGGGGEKFRNNPVPTFVLEIFDDTYDGGATQTEGWFVNTNLETDYYLLGWMPSVSVFRSETGIDGSIVVYEPADPEGIQTKIEEHDTLSNHVLTPPDTAPGTFRFRATQEVLNQFEATIEPIPEPVRRGEESGDDYYAPANIHELPVVVVEVDKLRDELRDRGLDPQTLRELGTEVAKTGDTQRVDNRLSGGKIMKSYRNGENPVNLVVPYEFYCRMAAGVYLITHDSANAGQQFFE